MTPIDIILIVGLSVAVVSAVLYLIKAKRKGGCGCGCAHCPNASACGTKHKQDTKETAQEQGEEQDA